MAEVWKILYLTGVLLPFWTRKRQNPPRERQSGGPRAGGNKWQVSGCLIWVLRKAGIEMEPAEARPGCGAATSHWASGAVGAVTGPGPFCSTQVFSHARSVISKSARCWRPCRWRLSGNGLRTSAHAQKDKTRSPCHCPGIVFSSKAGWATRLVSEVPKPRTNNPFFFTEFSVPVVQHDRELEHLLHVPLAPTGGRYKWRCFEDLYQLLKIIS